MGESQTPHPPAGFAGSPGCFNPPDPNISFSFPFLPFVCPSSSSSSSSFKYSFYVQRFKKEKKVKGFFFFFSGSVLLANRALCPQTGALPPSSTSLGASSNLRPARPPARPGPSLPRGRCFPPSFVLPGPHLPEYPRQRGRGGGPSSVPPGGVVVCRRGFSSLFCKVPRQGGSTVYSRLIPATTCPLCSAAA